MRAGIVFADAESGRRASAMWEALYAEHPFTRQRQEQRLRPALGFAPPRESSTIIIHREADSAGAILHRQ